MRLYLYYDPNFKTFYWSKTKIDLRKNYYFFMNEDNEFNYHYTNGIVRYEYLGYI